MIEAILPAPPGVNGLYTNVPGKGRVKTARYRQWIATAGILLNLARLTAPDGPAAVYVRVGKPGVRRDLDGYLKALIDLLVTCRVLKDDGPAQVGMITASWRHDEIAPGCVGLSLSSIQRGEG